MKFLERGDGVIYLTILGWIAVAVLIVMGVAFS